MSIDRREDAGDFYPGGKVISTQPLAPGGDYLAKEDVVAPSDTAETGQAADAKATHDQLAGKVPTSRTINGKALSSDVTLTGADIAVSGTDATKISDALAGKLDKSAVVAPSTDPADEGKAADAKATGDALLAKRGYNDLSYSEQVVAWPDEVTFSDGYTLPSGVTYRLDFNDAGIPSYINFYDGDTPVGSGTFESELEPDGLILCYADERSIGGEPQYTWPSTVSIKQTRTTVNSKLMRDMSGGNYDTAQKILDAINGGLAGKEDASNKVTSLTAQSTDTQYPSAKCVYDALQGVDTKVKELFNADENVKCDGEGQVFKAEWTGNYWTSGSSTYNFTSKNTSGGGTFYVYGTGLSALSYNPATGLLTNSYGQTRCQCGVGLNPLAGDDISPTDGSTAYTFTKLTNRWPSNPTDLFARVSDLAAFSTTKSYAVGDIAGYDGKVYKCTTAHTGAWNASHFTLATKAEVQAYLAGIVVSISGKQSALSQSQLDNIAAVPNKANDDAVVKLTGSQTISGTKNFTGGITSDTDGTPLTTNGLQIGITGNQNKIRVFQDGTSRDLKFYRLGTWEMVTLHMVNGKTVAFTAANPTAGNLAALDTDGNPVDAGWTAGDLARYSLTVKTISNNAVVLDDRADNYVDARTLGSSDSLDIDFPALVDGKARDFVLAVECGANPPAISYAAFVTIMAEDA